MFNKENNLIFSCSLKGDLHNIADIEEDKFATLWQRD